MIDSSAFTQPRHCALGHVADLGVFIPLAHRFELGHDRLWRLPEFGHGEHSIVANLCVGVVKCLSQGVGHLGIGVADVSQLEHRLAANLWLGIV
jgi:hypothetical protein